jgi:hypothetical protein
MRTPDAHMSTTYYMQIIFHNLIAHTLLTYPLSRRFFRPNPEIDVFLL